MRVAALIVGLLLLAAPGWGAGMSRSVLETLERSVDQQVSALAAVEEPVYPIVPARAVYLEGVGTVITLELNLFATAPASPFAPQVPAVQTSKIRQRKLERLPLLREGMRTMLCSVAKALDQMPATESVYLVVNLFHFKFEDTKDLPSQIVMAAPRGKLAAKPAPDVLTALVKMREY